MKEQHLLKKDGVSYVLPFLLVVSCFALWGFANDITNPMVKAFSKIFRMSVMEGTLVQVAFYGGYFVMAFPAALFIRRYSYKAGVLMGLALYAAGCFLFFPARLSGNYYPFLIAYFILTCGLSFLETSCNPFVLSMGEESTATRRLNLAQSFNPIGSLGGMFVAMIFIQARLYPLSADERALLSPSEFESMKMADLHILIQPYLFIGIVIALIFLAIRFLPIPRHHDAEGRDDLRSSFCRLLRIPRYREGVVAQFFYVGAQIMCWTFIIQYGTKVLMQLHPDMSEQAAEILSQRYNIVAMVLFCVSRFICTFLLRYISAGRLLTSFAIAAIGLLFGVIFGKGMIGLYCLVGVSVCMSLMFPTIYGESLRGLGHDAKLASAGLIMSILGGSVLPPLQAWIIDQENFLGLSGVSASFIVPMFCFLVIAVYGMRTMLRSRMKAVS